MIFIGFWPCDACFLFGVGCTPCTLGASLLCPNHCAMMAEREVNNYLEDVSLTKKYYERSITWTLQKTFWDSWIEISVPTKLFPIGRLRSMDFEGKDKVREIKNEAISDIIVGEVVVSRKDK